MTSTSDTSSLPVFRDPFAERKATWMELFFDLAFVIAIASTAHTLSSSKLPAGLLDFAVLFLLLQWAWAGYTFYSDRFDTDHLGQRLLALAQMALVLGIASLHEWLGRDFGLFVLIYCVLRAITIGANLVSGRHIPEVYRMTRRYSAGIALSLLPLLLAVSVEDKGLRLALVGLTAVLQFMPTALAHRQGAMPLSISHIPERLGLFITLALGECLVGITRAGSIAPSISTLSTGVLALLLVFCVWSIYFACLDGSALRQSPFRAVAWIYLHAPLSMSIVAMGVGLEETLHRLLEPSVHGSRLLYLSWGVSMVCIAAISALRPIQGIGFRRGLAWTSGLFGLAAVILPFVFEPGPGFTLITLAGAGVLLLILLLIPGTSSVHHVGESMDSPEEA